MFADDNSMDDLKIYYKRERPRVAIAIVVAVFILLLVVCIVLAVLYAQTDTDRAREPVVKKPGKKYEICNEDRCFEIGKAIVHSLNQSVNPCDDFYAYACGGWQKRNPLDGAQQSTVMGNLVKENNDILPRALEQASRSYSKNVAVMKTARFYKSCMNTTAIESVGIQPLLSLVAEFGGWSVFNNSDPGVSIETRIARAVRELNVDSLIGAISMTDRYNSSTKILVMHPAVLTYHTSLYLNKSEKVRNQIKENIQEFAKAFGINGTVPKLMAIYDFETKLAQIATGKTPEEELLESVKKSIQEKRAITDHRMKMKDFCVNSGFSCALLKRILKMTYSRSFTGEELLLVTNITYYKNLHKLYQATLSAGNRQVIEDYVMWRVVFQYFGALSSSLNASSVTPSSRSSYCINKLMMDVFDKTLGLMYVDAKFDDKSKKTVQQMTDDLKQAFIKRLPQQTWMDPETQRKAKEKALAIKIFIGYPTYIKDPKKLEDHYKSLIVTDDFFSNIKAINQFSRRKLIKSYGKAIDKNVWLDLDEDSPALVNGYYCLLANAITYLAGIIQPPFYNPEYPRYMQYGGIGTVIGHELTHGFDSDGRKYDKDGNLHNWWSSSADANFKEKAQCIVNQYDKYTFHGMKVNGTLTIDENIADNGGIKIAYDAYQRWAAKNGTEKILPGLNLTPDQLFFVGFAQKWCGVFNKKGALAQLRDEHSPGKYRVIGSLSNNEKFSEVFQCPVGSPMNPKNKCSVW